MRKMSCRAFSPYSEGPCHSEGPCPHFLFTYATPGEVQRKLPLSYANQLGKVIRYANGLQFPSTSSGRPKPLAPHPGSIATPNLKRKNPSRCFDAASVFGRGSFYWSALEPETLLTLSLDTLTNGTDNSQV